MCGGHRERPWIAIPRLGQTFEDDEPLTEAPDLVGGPCHRRPDIRPVAPEIASPIAGENKRSYGRIACEAIEQGGVAPPTNSRSIDDLAVGCQSMSAGQLRSLISPPRPFAQAA